MEIETFESIEEMDEFHWQRRHGMVPQERLEIYGQLNNVAEASEDLFQDSGIPVRFDIDDQVIYE